MTYTRMMIMEAISDEQTKQINGLLDSHTADVSGLVSARRLSEQNGRLVVYETTFLTREELFRYHTSRQYRQLVVAIAPLLVGDPVIKLFTSLEYIAGRPCHLDFTENQDGDRKCRDCGLETEASEILD